MNLLTWNNPCLLIHHSCIPHLLHDHISFLVGYLSSYLLVHAGIMTSQSFRVMLRRAPPVFVFCKDEQSQPILPFAILIAGLFLSIITWELLKSQANSWLLVVTWVQKLQFANPWTFCPICRHCLKETIAKNIP